MDKHIQTTVDFGDKQSDIGCLCAETESCPICKDEKIAAGQGSVQGEDWLSDHEKKVFKTAFEINQETILLMASHRQKAMDATCGGQGQSLNLYFEANESEEEVSRLHHLASIDPYIKSLYYVRSLNGVAKHKVDKNECVACEG